MRKSVQIGKMKMQKKCIAKNLKSVLVAFLLVKRYLEKE